MPHTGLRSIRRDTKPPLHLSYRCDDGQKFELPFITGVLADLSGTPTQPLPKLQHRKWVDVDQYEFDRFLRSVSPKIKEPIPCTWSQERQPIVEELSFQSMDDFAPPSIMLRVPLLAMLHEVRTRLTAQLDRACNGSAWNGEEFLASLLNKHCVGSSCELPPILAEVNRLQESDLGHDPGQGKRLIQQIDTVVSEQIAYILQHPTFKSLHATWLGLEYLVKHSNACRDERVRVLDISKQELLSDLDAHEGAAWTASSLFKKLYEDQCGYLGETPFGMLIGDYYFDHGELDMAILEGISRIAAIAHAPFIAAASPALFHMTSWEDLPQLEYQRDVMTGSEYARWDSFRQNQDSRFIALTLPRYLARMPYDERSRDNTETPIVESRDKRSCLWANTAYVLGANIHRSITRTGLPHSISGWKGGGRVEGLCAFRNGGEQMSTIGPTQVVISDRSQHQLTSLGFATIVDYVQTDSACFLSVPSLHSAHTKDSRLPLILTVSRFANFVRCIVRDTYDNYVLRESIEKRLAAWLMQYVSGDDNDRLLRPLSKAEVTVQEDPATGRFSWDVAIELHERM
jgi:type VI secretion system protein ImpC